MQDTYTVEIVNEDRTYGYFEHNKYGEEKGGGLWFEDNSLVDFDGVSILPKEVICKLEKLGFEIDDSFKEQ